MIHVEKQKLSAFFYKTLYADLKKVSVRKNHHRKSAIFFHCFDASQIKTAVIKTY